MQSHWHMRTRNGVNHEDLVGSGRFALYALLAAAPMWLVFAGSFAAHELLVGSVVLVASISFALFMRSFRTFEVYLTLRDLGQGWRLPWYLIVDCSTILVVLCKDLFHIAPAGAYFRVCAFSQPSDDPRHSKPSDTGRLVLAAVFTTATPNSIVIGIRHQQMLFHQIARTPVEQMTRNLGAHSRPTTLSLSGERS
jgi:multisubunit Na+/H+ antiporter MnhE subunit